MRKKKNDGSQESKGKVSTKESPKQCVQKSSSHITTPSQERDNFKVKKEEGVNGKNSSGVEALRPSSKMQNRYRCDRQTQPNLISDERVAIVIVKNTTVGDRDLHTGT